MSPAGLAVVHTKPFPEDSGQRWKYYSFFHLIQRRFMPKLLHGGKAMLFMPPRHGKSTYTSGYLAAWYLMFYRTRNVILTSYSGALSKNFSQRAQLVVVALGFLFGVRLHPKKQAAADWQIQYLTEEGEWMDGGHVYATGVDGPLPGRGAHLIVMDDVVRGHRDTTSAQMQRAYEWWTGVLSTRLDSTDGTILLVMTRWAAADLAGRLLEDEPDEWEITVLRALAEDDDPLGRKPGEALCEERYPREWLEKRQSSSEEGGILFSALYQQEPIPDEGRIFKPEHMPRWEAFGDEIVFGPNRVDIDDLKLWFVTIDPALKEKEVNDPTGFLLFAIGPRGELLLIDDRTARMAGTDGLIPLMHQIADDYEGCQFFVEEAAHGTEVMRAVSREGFFPMSLDADLDKLTRAISAQPAMAAGKVYFPARGYPALIKEILDFPGGKHDDRVDALAYGIQVWRDRARLLTAYSPKPKEREFPDRDDPDAEDRRDALEGKDPFWRRWKD